MYGNDVMDLTVSRLRSMQRIACVSLAQDRNPRRGSVQRLSFLLRRIIPAVHEAGFACSAASLEDAEKHFARHGVERADDPSPRNLLCKGLRTERHVGDDEAVLSAFIGKRRSLRSPCPTGRLPDATHRRCATNARQAEEQIHVLRGFARRSRPRISYRIPWQVC